jgi:hypothetical protein
MGARGLVARNHCSQIGKARISDARDLKRSSKIDTKLILIDGLTGAGKSTTAQRVWLHLERHGHAARWFYEHDITHPIWQPNEQSRIVAAGVLDPDFINDILPRRWRILAGECSGNGKLTILESTLLQSTVGFLLAMNVPDRAIAEHIMTVDEAIAGLSPVLVYFRHRDVARSLKSIFEDRRADNYAASLVTLIGGTPYGKDRGLSDFAGLVRFYEHWGEIVELLFGKVAMAKLAIDGTSGDWPSRERRLTDFLGLPVIQEPDVRVANPSRFVGRYRDAVAGDELVVTGNEQGLALGVARQTRLIPAPRGGFHIAGVCAELSFGEESGGRFQRIDLRGNLPGLSPVWTRIEGER